MKKIKLSYIVLIASIVLIGISCKKQLDLVNPNAPNIEQVENEDGIYPFATGAVYVSGFQGISWLGDSYFSLCWGYHELLGDVIGAEASNNLINQISLPESIQYGGGSLITLPSKGKDILKANNSASKVGNNPLYYEWKQMYAMNNACNYLLYAADKIKFSNVNSDSADNQKTIKAWAYFWKGWAYSHIGSVYFAGIVNNSYNIGALSGGTNSLYVTHDAIIAEAQSNYDKAIAILNTNPATAVLSKIIPSFCQTGLGNVPAADEWIRNINTLKARNILVNKLAPLSSPTISNSSMLPASAADWALIKTLCTNGVKVGDNVFTGRTTSANNFASLSTGTIAAMSTSTSSTFKISERWVQDFKAGDARKTTNIKTGTYKNYVGGLTFSTRYATKDIGINYGGVAPTYFYSDKQDAGNTPIYMGTSYEENELMLAEALIYIGGAGSIDNGLSHVDNSRNSQLAALPTVTGLGLTKAQALQEIRMERRTALAFRGLSFYDARRWGYSYSIANGGGRTGCNIYDANLSAIQTNCTINYNFSDFWDVPDNESATNVPSTGSAPIRTNN